MLTGTTEQTKWAFFSFLKRINKSRIFETEISRDLEEMLSVLLQQIRTWILLLPFLSHESEGALWRLPTLKK